MILTTFNSLWCGNAGQHVTHPNLVYQSNLRVNMSLGHPQVPVSLSVGNPQVN